MRGLGKRRRVGAPRLIGKEFSIFSFLFPRGRGGLQSGGTGDRGLVSSLTLRDSSGREEGERVLRRGVKEGEKRKVNKKKENRWEKLVKK